MVTKDSENKKVLGATRTLYNDILFRSILEKSCYKKLEESELTFSYETERILLWEGCKLSIPIFAPKKSGPGRYGRFLEQQTRSLLNITYTPDFVVLYKDYKIYFDVKGKENDTYPLKKKMFIKCLQQRQDEFKYIFMEPHNVRQMIQAIDLIKTL